MPGSPAGHRAEERVSLRHGEAEVRRTRALTGRNAFRATAFSTSSSASSCADPMCSMSRDPRWDEHTTCTAAGLDAVFTVSRWGYSGQTLRPRFSAHIRSPRATNLQVRAMSQPKILDREPSQVTKRTPAPTRRRSTGGVTGYIRPAVHRGRSGTGGGWQLLPAADRADIRTGRGHPASGGDHVLHSAIAARAAALLPEPSRLTRWPDPRYRRGRRLGRLPRGGFRRQCDGRWRLGRTKAVAAGTARLPAVGSGTATGPADLLAERVVVLVLALPFALAPGLLPQFPLSTLSCGTDRDGVRLLREPRGLYPLAPLGHRLIEVSPARLVRARDLRLPGRPGRAGAGRGRHPLAATAPAGTSRRPGTPAPGAGLARIRAAHRPHAHCGLTREADPRPRAGNTTNLILIWRPFPVSLSGTVTVPHLAAR